MWNDEQTRENPTDETTPMTETTPEATTSVATAEPTAESASVSETIVAESSDAVATDSTAEPVAETVPAEPGAVAETPAEPTGETAAPVAETVAPTEPAPTPVAEPAVSSPVAAMSTETQPATEEPISMDEAIEQSFPSFEPGEVIQATVVQVDREGALVDVGTKTEIKIPKEELGTGKIESAEEVVRVGDTIDVKVVRTRGEGGAPVLSKREADFDKLWHSIVQAYHNKETLEAMVEDAVKGGVVVNIGVRCFVPASQIARRLPPNQLDRLVGEVIPIKIIDIDEEKRKVVASHKLAEEELRKQREEEERQRRERVFATLKVGQQFQGVVKRIVSYGAFVDIGEYEGLLHISEMSWARVENPREVLKEGDVIEVVVIRLEPEQGKVALSRRQVMPDPWQLAAQQYKEGDEIEAPITRVARTGAFARVMEGVEAFLPLSELSSKRVKSADEVVQVGETVKGRIIELDPRRRRMVVSLRAPEEQRAVQEHRQRTGGSKSTGFTIGERLSSQLQQLRTEAAATEAATDSPEPDAPAAGTETDAPND